MTLVMATSEGLSPLIGNARAYELAGRMFGRANPPHAMLFLGPTHVGKRTVLKQCLARLLGLPVLNEAGWSSFFTSPDFVLVEREYDEKNERPKKNIAVEQIRALRERLSMGSLMAGWKIAVIDGAEYLSESAANALLKTLEEPTPRTVIVLVADERGGIPDTVLSRLQTVRFHLTPTQEIARALTARGIDRETAAACAGRAEGRPGLALAMAEDPTLRAAFDTHVMRVVQALAVPFYARMSLLADALPDKSSFVEQTQTVRDVARAVQFVLRDVLSLVVREPARLGLPDAHAAIQTYANTLTVRDIAERLTRTEQCLHDTDHNMNPKLILDSLACAL